MVDSPMQRNQPQRSAKFCPLAGAMICSLFVIPGSRLAAAGPPKPNRTGEQIYRQQCASCHGAKGEGTDDNYPRALVGDRSVVNLARLIAKTMPEDAPGDCVGEDADKVAAFIFDSFYSKAAQAATGFTLPGSSFLT